MTSTKRDRMLRLLACAVILTAGLALSPADAQTQSGSNPTAASVTEQQVLEEFGRIRGSITIPDRKASMLEQPQGREYRAFHENTLPWIGGIAIIGMLVILAAFYLIWGRVRTEAPSAGIKVRRFNVLDRLTHWVTATAFVVLAITGLNYVYGKRLLMPLIGPNAFSDWSYWAKFAHNFMSWAFMAGVLVMLVLWIKDNIPDRFDWAWLKAGGGFFDRTGRTHPPAAKFNAGQKVIFWSVILGGAVLTVSGILLLFPFYFAGVNGMQMAQYVHAVVGMLMIAVILAHIYIGTIGMESAFDAMSTGEVDLAWAKEHHPVWVERMHAGMDGGRPEMPPRASPAE